MHHDKIINKVRIERRYLNIIGPIYNKFIANIMLNRENEKIFL